MPPLAAAAATTIFVTTVASSVQAAVQSAVLEKTRVRQKNRQVHPPAPKHRQLPVQIYQLRSSIY